MTDLISVSDANGVRTLRFNRLEKKNAITRAMYAALADGLEEALTKLFVTELPPAQTSLSEMLNCSTISRAV